MDSLYAFSPTGTQLWTFDTAASIHSSPAVGSDGPISCLTN
ncbi:MAG: PQQ-binding-like beta-propeller repeat protein [Candidatus Thiodiazotropha sp.]